MATNKTGGPVDLYAMACSALCIVHCLALPALVAFIPAVALAADAEWLHVLFVIAAAPATLWVVSRAVAAGDSVLVIAGACIGLALLAFAAFVETPYETTLTTAGAVLLLGVHGQRWWRYRGVRANPLAG